MKMVSLIFLSSLFSLNALAADEALKFEVPRCTKGTFQYTFHTYRLDVMEKVSEGVITGWEHITDRTVATSSRTISNENGKKIVTYSYQMVGGDSSQFSFEMGEMTDAFPDGFPQFVGGQYQSSEEVPPFIFDDCKL